MPFVRVCLSLLHFVMFTERFAQVITLYFVIHVYIALFYPMSV